MNFVNAEQINQQIYINVQCSNSTYANITYIKYTSDSFFILNQTTSMNKLSTDNYRYLINKSLNNRTGEIEYGYQCDLNGIQISAGNKIMISQPSSYWIWLTLTILALIFLLFSIMTDEETFVYISGIFFLITGIYIMLNGLDILSIRDLYVKVISYIFIGLGILFTIGAYTFNRFSNSAKDYYEDE